MSAIVRKNFSYYLNRHERALLDFEKILIQGTDDESLKALRETDKTREDIFEYLRETLLMFHIEEETDIDISIEEKKNE